MERLVLIVDDDEVFTKMMTYYFHSRGVMALTAPNGDQALEVLKQHGEDIGLIVLDIAMPFMNGFRLAEIIRQDTQFAETPLVAITARKGPDVNAQAQEVGISIVLHKPIDLDLLDTICQKLGLIPSDTATST